MKPEAIVLAEARDYLDEAARILSGRTLMIAQREHVEAVAQLVREAYALLNGDEADCSSEIVWLDKARNLLGLR